MGRIAERQLARKSMGFCLQQNVCYDSISAHDHLLFIAKLRGLEAKTRNLEVRKLVNKQHSSTNELRVSSISSAYFDISFLKTERLPYLVITY